MLEYELDALVETVRLGKLHFGKITEHEDNDE
jgi:hypothetical protein